LEALKERRRSTAATAAPASRRSARAGDLESPVAIIIAAIALRSWGSVAAEVGGDVGCGAGGVGARGLGARETGKGFVASRAGAPFRAAQPNGHLDLYSCRPAAAEQRDAPRRGDGPYWGHKKRCVGGPEVAERDWVVPAARCPLFCAARCAPHMSASGSPEDGARWVRWWGPESFRWGVQRIKHAELGPVPSDRKRSGPTELL